jgi:uncharacterized protein (UPF0332 family)
MSVSRSYYAVFYLAKSLLAKKRVFPKTHNGVIHQFSLEYVKNGNFDYEIFSFFTELKEYRREADYVVSIQFNKKQAKECLNNAKIFLEESKKFLY